MKNKDNEPYIITPLWLVKLTSNKKSPGYLTPFQRELYSLIRGLSQKKPCYASDEYLASIFNCTVKHINKSLSILEYKTYLNRNHENNNRYISINNNIDKGSIMMFIEPNRMVSFTTENNYYQLSWDEYNEIIKDENNLLFEKII